jgi:hypothetical protein
VTRHLARLLGGDVNLCEPKTTGCTFEVRLPRYIVRRDGMRAEPDGEEPLAKSGEGTEPRVRVM